MDLMIVGSLRPVSLIQAEYKKPYKDAEGVDSSE